MPSRHSFVAIFAISLLAALVGCAGAKPRPAGHAVGVRAAAIAASQVGTPYRYGGSSPAGFDCSGLVLYSYARAGLRGLPHSAAALEQRARAVPLAELAPGDLLFFTLEGKKTSHVAIYLGDRTFVHAPSAGRHVETVGFAHNHWGPRIHRAGRLAP